MEIVSFSFTGENVLYEKLNAVEFPGSIYVSLFKSLVSLGFEIHWAAELLQKLKFATAG